MKTSATFSLPTPGFSIANPNAVLLLMSWIALIILPAGAFAQGCGVLNNASFESGITSWTTQSASYGYNTSLYIADGSRSLWIAPSRSGRTARVYQDYKAAAGGFYELAFYGGTHDPRYTQNLSLEFYDKNNALLLRETVEVNHNVHPTNLLAAYQLSATAPTGTNILRVIGTANGDYLKLDYMCLTESLTGSFPVEWLDFAVSTNKSNYAELTWATASELNASHFEIERSVDKLTYAYIGEVQASGTSQSINEYQFTDEQTDEVKAASIYYRLRQVDFDGSYSYSNVIEFNPESTLQFSSKAYPNPTNTNLSIEVTGNQALNQLRIISTVGQEVYKKTIDSGTLSYTQTIDVSTWPAGAYHVIISGENETKTHQIFKQ